MTDHASPSSEDRTEAVFEAYLRDRGIKLTLPRRRILEAVLEMPGHFEAEQVLTRLSNKVSKATLYRTLPLLVAAGILRQQRFDEGRARYENVLDERPHDHMICRRCGRIVEFDAEEVLEMRQRLARAHHFHVVTHRFQMWGLCWECSINCPVAHAPIVSIPPRVTSAPKPRRTSRRRP